MGSMGLSQYEDVVIRGIPMLKIRRSWDRLIFKMVIPYMWKIIFILRRGPVSDGTKHVTAGTGVMHGQQSQVHFEFYL